MNRKIITRNSEEEEESKIQELYLPFAERVVQYTQIVVPIDEGIQPPRYYRNVVERLKNLSEDDECRFSINSEGGRLDGLLSLLDAIQNTEATTVAEIIGEVHSAAGILALNCEVVQVSPYASMLVHNVQFGAAGSGSYVRDMVRHTLDFSDYLFRNTYSGFLTEKEIEEVFNGREMWLQSDEIKRRLNNKFEYLKSLQGASTNPESEVAPESTKQLKS